MRTGRYDVRTTAVSDIAAGQRGRLIKVSNAQSKVGFLIAYDQEVTAGSLPVAAGWRAKEVGRDGMWVPEACAQKPSWPIGVRYLLINDARYESAKVIDSYVLYDLKRRTFSYLTDPDSHRGQAPSKVLRVQIQDEQIVFYLDYRDRTGPHSASRDFRHSSAHHNGYVVRRVISPRDLSFVDYKVPFSAPSINDYTIQIFGADANLFLGINDESRSTRETAELTPGKQLLLEPGWYVTPPDPSADAALREAAAAVEGKQPGRTTTTRDANVNIAGRAGGKIYLRLGSNRTAASLPGVFDADRKTISLPLGDDFTMAGFVIGVIT